MAVPPLLVVLVMAPGMAVGMAVVVVLAGMAVGMAVVVVLAGMAVGMAVVVVLAGMAVGQRDRPPTETVPVAQDCRKKLIPFFLLLSFY